MSGHDALPELVRQWITAVGEDPNREGLRDTPRRVAAAWAEYTKGYTADPAKLLTTFEDGASNYNEMVFVGEIPVTSLCEHHWAPFIGKAQVAYIPRKRIVGLSKIPRLVDAFARRLQVQERLTVQIADCLMEHLDPQGVGVILRCRHLCMETRGIKAHGVVTSTSALRGAFMQPETRQEFMHLGGQNVRQVEI